MAKSMVYKITDNDPYKELFACEFTLMASEYNNAEVILKNISQESLNTQDLMMNYCLLSAQLYIRVGDFAKSQEALNHTKAIVSKLDTNDPNNLYNLINFHRTSGNFLQLQTQLRGALEHYHKILSMIESLDMKPIEAGVSHNIGMVYTILGMHEVATDYYEKSYRIWKENNAIMALPFIYEKMITNYLERGDRKTAKRYMTEFDILMDPEDQSMNGVSYNLAKGRYLKSSSRGIHKFQSQDYFRKILTNENAEYNSVMQALINLAETLIDELRIDPNEEVINELISISRQIVYQASKFNSRHIIFSLLLLQADFAILRGEIKTAEGFLHEARELIHNSDLEYLVDKVNVKEKEIFTMIETWQSAMKGLKSVIDKLELLRLKEYLSDVSDVKKQL